MNTHILDQILYIIFNVLVVSTQETTYENEHNDGIALYSNYYDYEDMELGNSYEDNKELASNSRTYINLDDEIEYPNARKGAVDWFDEVQFLFPRDSYATVIDVDTGKSFRIKRTFGTNHADVEPLTTEDAAIIKEIWGGTWNWERRAVVVKPDNGGHLLAGSMTGFPHAGLNDYPALAIVNNRSGGYGTGQNFDVVKGNGVDGHFDIHFLNSRTHGTNVMQQEHQNMVQKAANYILENY